MIRNLLNKLSKLIKYRSVKIALVVLTAGAGSLVTYLLVQALTVSDDFSTSAKVSKTWHTEVDTTAGVARLMTKTCDDDVWYCSLNNVVADTLGDGDFVVVARADESSTLQWKTGNTACDRPQCGTDGGQDGDNLVADNTVNFSGYTARDYCRVKGGRLPTLAELQSIYINRAQFGSFQASSYWSATEFNALYAWRVNFSDGSVGYGTKDNAYYVRCVQGW